MTQVEMLQAIQTLASPWLDGLMIAFSFIGDEEFYIATVPLIYYAVNKRVGIRLAIVLACSMFVNAWIKVLFASPRPIGVEGIRSLYTSSATGMSFPSGHSQGSATYWGYLAALVKNLWFRCLAVLVMLTIPFSRLYLGVHWPIDVVAGLVLGLLFVSGMVWADATFVHKWGSRTKLVMGLVVPLVLLAFYHQTEGLKLAGFLLGTWTGYVMEGERVGMQIPKRWRDRVVPTLVGLVVVLGTRWGVKGVLPEGGVYDFLRYAVVGFVATMGVPWLLVKWKWYLGRR